MNDICKICGNKIVRNKSIGSFNVNKNARPSIIKSEPDPSVFYGTWILSRSYNWIKSFESVFGIPDIGRNRTVFHSGDYVYKVPNSEKGIDDNIHECNKSGCHLAPCWVEYDADGFPILIMEAVADSLWEDCSMNKLILKLPDWTNSIDCMQVGYSKISGLLVAYDYGYW